MKSGFFTKIASAVALAGALVAPSQAAFISIDDSDPAFITITAGDFEGGFFVDGALLTIGLGSSGSITFPDGGHSISGSWIDLGATPAGARVDLLFALASDPAFATSGIEFAASTDGFFGTLGGSFGGFIDPTLYFATPLPTTPQDGHTEFGSVPFLSVSFKSEAVLPTPGTLALTGLLLVGLPLLRRRVAG